MPATITVPRDSYPRPHLIHDHTSLFIEPAYPDGQPYADDQDEGDEDADD
ncbi:hypothetical protein ACWEGQ_00115 [Streptomyces seoulensis]